MVKSLLKRQKPVKRESGASSEEGLGVQKRYNSPSKLLAWIVELKQAFNHLASILAPMQVCWSTPLRLRSVLFDILWDLLMWSLCGYWGDLTRFSGLTGLAVHLDRQSPVSLCSPRL